MNLLKIILKSHVKLRFKIFFLSKLTLKLRLLFCPINLLFCSYTKILSTPLLKMKSYLLLKQNKLKQESLVYSTR